MKSELNMAPLPYIVYNEKVTSRLFAMFRFFFFFCEITGSAYFSHIYSNQCTLPLTGCTKSPAYEIYDECMVQ